jgi:asparaginyl-tRNA synthetase
MTGGSATTAHGATVAVRGWVMTTRSSGKIAFLVLRDGTGTVQGVLSKKEGSDPNLGRVRRADPGGESVAA